MAKQLLKQNDLNKYWIINCENELEINNLLDYYGDIVYSYRITNKTKKLIIPRDYPLDDKRYYVIVIGNPDNKKSRYYISENIDTKDLNKASLFTSTKAAMTSKKYYNRNSALFHTDYAQKVWVEPVITDGVNTIIVK